MQLYSNDCQRTTGKIIRALMCCIVYYSCPEPEERALTSKLRYSGTFTRFGFRLKFGVFGVFLTGAGFHAFWLFSCVSLGYCEFGILSK